MEKQLTPRTGNSYGMQILPVVMGNTWIEGEMWCTDYGQFRRRALARHKKTNELVLCHADIPDTYFSIPACTESEHGYITSSETGFEFNPDLDQSQPIKQWKKQYRKVYK